MMSDWRGGRGAVVAAHGVGRQRARPSAPDSSWGDGVYKSTRRQDVDDAGLKDTRSIARIVIDPTDANVVYVAAQGHFVDRTPSAACSRRPTAVGRGPRCRSWTRTRSERPRHRPRGSAGCSTPRPISASEPAWGFNGVVRIRRVQDDGRWRDLDELAASGLAGRRQGRIALCALRERSAGRVRARSKRVAERRHLSNCSMPAPTWEKTSSLNTRPNYFSNPHRSRDREHIYTLGSRPRILIL